MNEYELLDLDARLLRLKLKLRRKSGIIYKTVPIVRIETKGQKDPRIVTSLYSVFGVVDDVGDRMWNGAYQKTLVESADRIRVLWNHDPAQPPIGVPMSLKEIGRNELPVWIRAKFPDATGGLYGEVRYLDTPRGNEVLQGIKDGAITENSVGVRVTTHSYTPDKVLDLTIREVKAVDLWDISPVTWGANRAARVVRT